MKHELHKALNAAKRSIAARGPLARPGVTYSADLKPGDIVEILGSDGSRIWMPWDTYVSLNGVDVATEE